MKEGTLAQANHFLTLINQKGVQAEQLQELYESGLLADLLDANVGEVNRDDFRKLCGLTPLEPRITVDYGMSLADMVKAGHYDWANKDITSKNFPNTRKGKDDVMPELVHFNRTITSDEAIAELDTMGFRSGTIEELLAYGATSPETQRKFPIIALGSSSVVHGYRLVAYLGYLGRLRGAREASASTGGATGGTTAVGSSPSAILPDSRQVALWFLVHLDLSL